MKKENVIRVYIAHPDKGVHYEGLIMNKLESFQDKVNGLIQIAPLSNFTEKGILPIVNEEGLLKGLDYNENLYPFFLVGTVVFVADVGEEFGSLTDEQIEYIKHFCNEVKE